MGPQPCEEDSSLQGQFPPGAQGPAGADSSVQLPQPPGHTGLCLPALGGLGLQISTALEQDLGYIQGEIWGPASPAVLPPFLTIPHVLQSTAHQRFCLGAFAQLALPLSALPFLGHQSLVVCSCSGELILDTRLLASKQDLG